MDYEKQEQVLITIFSALREQERKDTPKLASAIGAFNEFCILMNRRWKWETGKEDQITDLEAIIHNQAGYYVRAYVTEHLAKVSEKTSIKVVPYPHMNLTLLELVNRINEALEAKGDKIEKLIPCETQST